MHSLEATDYDNDPDNNDNNNSDEEIIDKLFVYRQRIRIAEEFFKLGIIINIVIIIITS